MNKERKIELVGGKVSFEEETDEQLDYWLSLTPQQRMAEATEWNYKIWKFKLKDDFPVAVEKIGKKVLKALTDEDDF